MEAYRALDPGLPTSAEEDGTRRPGRGQVDNLYRLGGPNVEVFDRSELVDVGGVGRRSRRR
jgi:hypothetical protein